MACLALVLPGSAAGLPGDDTKPPGLKDKRRGAFSTLLSGVSPFTEDCGDDPDETGGSGVDGREYEPHVAVDPDDLEHLVATWQQDRYAGGPFAGGARSDLVTSSFDGGATWTAPAVIDELTKCSGGKRHRASDPHVAVGADGVAWFTGMPSTVTVRLPEGADFDADIMMARSDDGGRSWPDPAVLVASDDGQHWHEWPTIQADPHRPGRAWIAWADHLSPDPPGNAFVSVDVSVSFSSTTNGGATWSPAITLPGNVPNVVEWPLHIAAFGKPNDRILVVTYAQFKNRITTGGLGEAADLFSVRSTDGGMTWEEPVHIAKRGGVAAQLHPLTPVQTGRSDLLMASWIENFGDGGTVVLAQSKDQGQSWSLEVVDRIFNSQFEQANARMIGPAQASDGTRGVAWFLTGAPDGLVHVLLATDSGGGWSTREVESLGGNPPAPGDYFGMVGLEDAFGMVYVVGEVPEPEGDGPSNVVFTRAPSKTR